jgi:hypothetical protein
MNSRQDLKCQYETSLWKDLAYLSEPAMCHVLEVTLAVTTERMTDYCGLLESPKLR